MAILLVSGATATVRRYADVGVLLTPRNGNSITTIAASGRPVACDNDCFQRLDASAYRSMVELVAVHLAPLFVVVPDAVADADATIRRWQQWRGLLAHHGLRAAFVAQDGQERRRVPWNELDALFIGGSTAWKEGSHALRLAQEAKMRGKWVHVGRVNTLRRLRLFSSVDVDSIDGTAFSRFPDRWIPWILPYLNVKQYAMEDILLCSSSSISRRSSSLIS